MTEENYNQIELRAAGGIGRQSDLVRRGMNAFDYVSRLAAKQEKDLQHTNIPKKYTDEFLSTSLNHTIGHQISAPK